VIEREQGLRAPGQPLVLGNQTPPRSAGAPAPIAERVRQALGVQQQVQPLPPPQPTPQNPYGLVPPGRIPNARLGVDQTVTGSIGGASRKAEAEKKAPNKSGANLMSPQPLADQEFPQEPASVFNLPAAKAALN
jgi:hypothetical protein